MSFWCHRLDQNSNQNFVKVSPLKSFLASLGLPGSFLGLPVGFLGNDITLLNPQKAKKGSRKPPGSYKTYQGRNFDNIFVVILVQMMTPKIHFENLIKNLCAKNDIFSL